jgi:mono/diheme cytochrome c family protein
VERRQFPPLSGGVAKHVDFVTIGSDFQKPYGSQGIGSGRMPGFGQELSARQIDEIVIYERSL